jgi:hypothetical protein
LRKISKPLDPPVSRPDRITDRPRSERADHSRPRPLPTAAPTASHCHFSTPVSPSRRPPSTASTRYKGSPTREGPFLFPLPSTPHYVVVPPLWNHCAAPPRPLRTPATTSSCHQATTVVSCQQFSMLQLWEDGSLRSGMPLAQAEQLAVSFGTRGKSTEGSLEGSCTTSGPRQLHHRGGDSHRRRSSSGYVLPQ